MRKLAARGAQGNGGGRRSPVVRRAGDRRPPPRNLPRPPVYNGSPPRPRDAILRGAGGIRTEPSRESMENRESTPWKERLRGWGDELRAARHDRRRALILGGLLAVGVGSCGTGAAIAAWTRACAGSCPTAAQIDDFAPAAGHRALRRPGRRAGDVLPRAAPARPHRHASRATSPWPSSPSRTAASSSTRASTCGAWWARCATTSSAAAARSGASTITMQLARNLFPEQLPPQEKSLRRKIAEARLALQHGAALLQAGDPRALPQPHLPGRGRLRDRGGGAHLLRQARARAHRGRGRHAGRRSRRRPRATTRAATRDAARGRRNVVLRRDGRARRRPAAEAAAPPAPARSRSPRPAASMRAPYFVEHVRRELEDRFGELLYTGGLRIHTTIDPVAAARRPRRRWRSTCEEIEKGELRLVPPPDLRRVHREARRATGRRSPDALPAGRGGGDGPAQRRRARHGRRARLRAVAVQPRHPGAAPARLLLQALRLRARRSSRAARPCYHVADDPDRRPAGRRQHLGAQELLGRLRGRR